MGSAIARLENAVVGQATLAKAARPRSVLMTVTKEVNVYLEGIVNVDLNTLESVVNIRVVLTIAMIEASVQMKASVNV